VLKKTIVVGGFTPFTTIDFPDHLAAVVFCQGCAWRCHYCHNTSLLDFKAETYSWQHILQFLETRRGLLDAVVFSGGEPTLQKNLLTAISEVRSLGFKIGLHTAGIQPDNFVSLLPYLDWVGFDIKAHFTDYEKITGIPKSGELALKSAQYLLNSGITCEFRTTIDTHFLTTESILSLAAQLAKLGVHQYVLQRCRISQYENLPVLADLLSKVQNFIPFTIIR